MIRAHDAAIACAVRLCIIALRSDNTLYPIELVQASLGRHGLRCNLAFFVLWRSLEVWHVNILALRVIEPHEVTITVTIITLLGDSLQAEICSLAVILARAEFAHSDPALR